MIYWNGEGIWLTCSCLERAVLLGYKVTKTELELIVNRHKDCS